MSGSEDLLEKVSECGFIVVFEGKSTYVFFLGAEGYNSNPQKN